MKLDSLRLEIVRFEAEDVIATSGGDLLSDGNYLALWSEAQQGGANSSNTFAYADVGNWAAFIASGGSPKWLSDGSSGYYYQRVSSGDISGLGDDAAAFCYAWYNETAGGWRTEGKSITSYQLNIDDTTVWRKQ